jgi:protein involved in polysaccharide export with SLBB domain
VSKGSFWKVISGEVEGGGGQELFASSMDSQGILVWQGQNGSLSSLSDFYGSSGTYYDMALSDLDSDGGQDLVAASDGQGVSIWAKQAQTRSFAAVSFSGFGASYTHERKEFFSINPQGNNVFVTIDGRPQYKIGPEDLLEISLWKGVEETKYLVPVRPDGMITFTFLEDIKVSGLTAQQVDDLLTSELSHYIRQPRVTVRVKEYNSKFVSLLGAIEPVSGVIIGPDTPRGSRSGPGTYALTGKTTVLQALARAGGPTEQANLRQVSVRRETGQAVTVNINKVITQGDVSQNVVLDSGDTVLVPPVAEDPRNRVFVFGEVKNPGVFPTKGEITVMEAIALSGGFEQRAVLGDAKILRGDMTRPEVIACDLNRLLKKGDMSQNITLHNGDVLYVPKNTIGRISDFLREIQPILDFILWPARVWDGYRGKAPFK